MKKGLLFISILFLLGNLELGAANADPIVLIVEADGQLTIVNKWTTNIRYSKNGGTKTTINSEDPATIKVEKGDRIEVDEKALGNSFNKWAANGDPFVKGVPCKITSMPAMSDFTTKSGTTAGDNFFRSFNHSGSIISLPAGSFDTSAITTVGNDCFRYFNQSGALTSLPDGSFDTSAITTVGNYFFRHFNASGALTSLPAGSFNTSAIKTVGSYFFAYFNYSGKLESLPSGSFKLSASLTTVNTNFFNGFNNDGALTYLPEGSFNASAITTVGSYFFTSFAQNGKKLTKLPASFALPASVSGTPTGYCENMFNNSALTKGDRAVKLHFAAAATNAFTSTNITPVSPTAGTVVYVNSGGTVNISITGIKVDDKTYDGTTTATLNTSAAVLKGVFDGDKVSLAASGVTVTFANAAAGTGKAVTVTGQFALSGADARIYVLTQPDPNTLKANITPKPLTATDITATVSSLHSYTGSPIVPLPEVKYGTTTLAVNTDYTLSYNNNTQPGDATVTITGKGNYSGSIQLTFKILSSDATLASLSLSEGSLTPEFNSTTYSYNVTVGNDITSLTIAATATHAKATVSGHTGTQRLSVGDNEFTITVTAEDGNHTQNYTVNILRAASIAWKGGGTGTDDNTKYNWSVPANWVDGALPASTDVVSFHTSAIALHVDGDYSIAGIINKTGQNVVVLKNASLSISGDLIDMKNARFVLQSGMDDGNNAALVVKKGTAVEAADVEFHTKAKADYPPGESGLMGKVNWQFFGTPLHGASALTFPGAYVRRFDNAKGGDVFWRNVLDGDHLDAFTGYEIATLTGRKQDFIFRGALQTDDKTISLTNYPAADNRQFAGQHVLANAYTAGLDIKTGLTFGSTLDPTVYLYHTGSQTDYDTGSGDHTAPGQYLAVPQGQAGANGLPATLSSMQGFVVKFATPGTGTADIKFTYEGAVGKNTVAMRSQAMETPKKASTKINLTSGGKLKDQMWIFVDEAATRGYDNNLDGHKILSSDRLSALYAREQDKNYQVNAVPDIHNSTLAFKPEEGIAEYTLSFSHENMSSLYGTLYLLDLETGAQTDITAHGSTYSFTAASKTAAAERFKIITEEGLRRQNGDEYFDCYQTGDRLHIVNKHKQEGSFRLYNTSGLQIYQLKADTYGQAAINKPAAGVYVLEGKYPDAEAALKVVVR